MTTKCRVTGQIRDDGTPALPTTMQPQLQAQKKNRKRQKLSDFCGLLIFSYYEKMLMPSRRCIRRKRSVSYDLWRDVLPILCSHSLTETVFVFSLSVRGLECSFHCCILFYVIILTNSGCKNREFFQINQEITHFLSKVFVFFTELH